MLSGADVSGWRYSGCSKWPLCAVNIFTIRIGSLLAWRNGSVRGLKVSLEPDGLSAPVRCWSPLVGDSGECLRKGGSGPPGGSLIWIRLRGATAGCNERTHGGNYHWPARFMMTLNRRDSAVIRRDVELRSARPPCRTQAVSLQRNKRTKCHPLSDSSIYHPLMSPI